VSTAYWSADRTDFGAASATAAAALVGFLFISDVDHPAPDPRRARPARPGRAHADPARTPLLAQVGGGLYWMVPAVLVAFICGLLNVWVLLAEIHRQRRAGHCQPGPGDLGFGSCTAWMRRPSR
jgi:hypothetical protein